MDAYQTLIAVILVMSAIFLVVWIVFGLILFQWLYKIVRAIRGVTTTNGYAVYSRNTTMSETDIKRLIRRELEKDKVH